MLSRLKAMSLPQLSALAADIRTTIIEVTNRSGGHLASNLGVVELTLAWHKVFSAPQDQLIFDVGHQCYPHKIITRGFKAFQTLKQPNGLAGFPSRFENPDFDPFGAGHASTSLSAAAGLARAKRILEKPGLVTALIGDASFAGGLALEALNDIGFHQDPVLILLNDNDFSIDPAVGGLSKTHQYRELCQSFNLDVYPDIVDGHDLKALCKVFRSARRQLLSFQSRPLVIHVKTIKGFGLEQAQHDPTSHHGVKANYLASPAPALIPADDLIARELLALMRQDPSVVVITPAMGSRSGLSIIQDTFPDRFFDVGIAEEHATTLAAGMAANGLKPFLVIYATFLQRSYDQLLHDVSIQRLPVRLIINRTGVAEHITHFGIYDISFLSPLPHFLLRAPVDDQDLIKNIHWLYVQNDNPSVIRYAPSPQHTPKKTDTALISVPPVLDASLSSPAVASFPSALTSISPAFLVLGKLTSPALLTRFNILLKKYPAATIFHLNAIKPLPRDFLRQQIFPHFSQIFTFEDGVVTGGWGEQVSLFAQQQGWQGEIKNIGIEA